MELENMDYNIVRGEKSNNQPINFMKIINKFSNEKITIIPKIIKGEVENQIYNTNFCERRLNTNIFCYETKEEEYCICGKEIKHIFHLMHKPTNTLFQCGLDCINKITNKTIGRSTKYCISCNEIVLNRRKRKIQNDWNLCCSDDCYYKIYFKNKKCGNKKNKQYPCCSNKCMQLTKKQKISENKKKNKQNNECIISSDSD
jgi:hypothetical protein